MPHIIRMPADASAAAVRLALAGARARDIALVFPLGAPCVAGTSEAMREMYLHALTLQKDVVILGGDGHMRATAVAAGFPAATSLAEWEATQPRLVTIISPSRQPEAEWDIPQLSIVPPEVERLPTRDPFDPFDDVPPEFVLELMALDGAYGACDTGDQPDTGTDAEAPDEDELRNAYEQYEEHITRAIRHTGGLVLSGSSHSSISPLPAIQSDPADDGDESRPM